MDDFLSARNRAVLEGQAQQLDRIERKLDYLFRSLKISDPRLDIEMPETVRPHVAAGDLIGAIKAYRAATGAGLKEAKDAVDAFMRNMKSDRQP